MASKRRQRRRGCNGKVAYPNLGAAIGAANRSGARHPGQRYNAYHCGRCGGYHFGHIQAVALRAMERRGER